MSESMDNLIEIVVKGKLKEGKAAAQACVDAGHGPKEIIFQGLSKAMEIVGDKYASKEYFLPQVLLSANTLYQGLNLVLPMLQAEQAASGEAAASGVVIAVIEGDVHDIGKNIVKAMLTGMGLTMFDMGKDVPVKDLVEKLKAEGASIMATSTLMTPTLAGMKDLEAVLKEEGLKGVSCKSIIGGGATSRDFADQIGADGWAYDAVEATSVVADLLKQLGR